MAGGRSWVEREDGTLRGRWPETTWPGRSEPARGQQHQAGPPGVRSGLRVWTPASPQRPDPHGGTDRQTGRRPQRGPRSPQPGSGLRKVTQLCWSHRVLSDGHCNCFPRGRRVPLTWPLQRVCLTCGRRVAGVWPWPQSRQMDAGPGPRAPSRPGAPSCREVPLGALGQGPHPPRGWPGRSLALSLTQRIGLRRGRPPARPGPPWLSVLGSRGAPAGRAGGQSAGLCGTRTAASGPAPAPTSAGENPLPRVQAQRTGARPSALGPGCHRIPRGPGRALGEGLSPSRPQTDPPEAQVPA